MRAYAVPGGVQFVETRTKTVIAGPINVSIAGASITAVAGRHIMIVPGNGQARLISPNLNGTGTFGSVTNQTFVPDCSATPKSMGSLDVPAPITGITDVDTERAGVQTNASLGRGARVTRGVQIRSGAQLLGTIVLGRQFTYRWCNDRRHRTRVGNEQSR